MNENRILGGDEDNGPGWRISEREEIENGEEHKPSFYVGLLADIPVWKRWSKLTGINYVQKNIEIEPRQIYAGQDPNGLVNTVSIAHPGMAL